MASLAKGYSSDPRLELGGEPRRWALAYDRRGSLALAKALAEPSSALSNNECGSGRASPLAFATFLCFILFDFAKLMVKKLGLNPKCFHCNLVFHVLVTSLPCRRETILKKDTLAFSVNLNGWS